jgi:Ni/Co efflux regulator RcnB
LFFCEESAIGGVNSLSCIFALLRYNSIMKKTLLLPLAAIALFAATITTSQVAGSVEPPPTEIHDTEAAHETVESGDSGGLKEELSAPEDLEEGTQVHSYTRKDGAEMTDYSINGRVYMIRVQPGGGLPAYYLYDSDGDSVFERRLPGGYKRPSPPMWVIKKF